MAETSHRTFAKRALVIAGVLVLWAAGSTGLGVLLGCVFNYCGHGTELYIFLAWLFGIVGLLMHMGWLISRWLSDAKKPSAV